MTALLAALLRWLGGGVLDKVLAHLSARAAAEGEAERLRSEAAIEAVRAEVDRRRAQRDVLIAEQGSWLTRLPRPLFAIPLGIWWAAVIADSLMHFSWNVAALPPPLDEWAGAIITALFLVEGAERVTGRLAKAGGRF